jgi:hypothetical protein
VKLLFVETAAGSSFMTQRDCTAMTETEFEYSVVRALAKSYPSHDCILFSGTFKHQGRGNRPDLALIAKDRSHWFIIEVELTTHSLYRHVVPQVESFVYGDPQDDCATILADRLNISIEKAKTIVAFVPYSVAVVADRFDPLWETTLRPLRCQLLAVSIFANDSGGEALHIEGVLRSNAKSVAFAKYSAIDKSLRCSKSLNLPQGSIQFIEPDGRPAMWTVRADDNATWITRNEGDARIPHLSYVHILMDVEGLLHLNVP